MMGGGLFNTSLKGTRLGRDPVRRPARAARRRERADVRRRAGRDHVVRGRVDLDPDRLQGIKNLIGRGSGETIQMAFSGQGWVLVQPVEGQVTAAGPVAAAAAPAACSASC